MVQAVEYRSCAHGNALSRPMPGLTLLCACKFVRRIRHAGAQGAMGAAPIVMRNPRLQDQPKVRFRNRDNPVEAFAPNRADHALADRVCPRRAQWRFQHREAQGPDRLIQVLCKDTVLVVNQISQLSRSAGKGSSKKSG